MLSAVNLVSQNSNSINFQGATWGYAKIADNISSVKPKKRTVSSNMYFSSERSTPIINYKGLIIKPLNFKEIKQFLKARK